jgi:hypothetical protein
VTALAAETLLGPVRRVGGFAHAGLVDASTGMVLGSVRAGPAAYPAAHRGPVAANLAMAHRELRELAAALVRDQQWPA